MGDLAYLGSLTIGAICPLAVSAQAMVLPELQARLLGAIEAHAQLSISPPSLSVNLQAALDLVAQLQAAIEIGLPSASIDIGLMANLIAEIQAQVDFLLSFNLLLGTPGIFAYRYYGASGDLIPGGLPDGNGPQEQVYGLLLFAADGGAWEGMQGFFKTS